MKPSTKDPLELKGSKAQTLSSYYRNLSKIRTDDTEAKVMLLYISPKETDTKNPLPSLQEKVKKERKAKNAYWYIGKGL